MKTLIKTLTTNSRIAIIVMISLIGLVIQSNAIAGDLCDALKPLSAGTKHAIDIVANGYTGRIGAKYGLAVKDEPSGGISFDGDASFDGDTETQVTGTCKNRHIRFTRIKNGSWTQSYEGYLFEKSRNAKAVGQEMSGTFSHNGKAGYGWCGHVVQIVTIR